MGFPSHVLQRRFGGWARRSSFILGKLDSANALLQKHGITVVSGDLSLVRDRTGNVYRIEKYCYSTPRNMKSAATEESVASRSLDPASHVANEMENNKFRFRVGAVCDEGDL